MRGATEMPMEPELESLWPSNAPPCSPSGGMGRHHSARGDKDEWLTPPDLLRTLGAFDLDPCSPVDRPWPTATRHLTWKDNGLLVPWEGRVWCNPPYGREAGRWLARCAEHGNATALIFARTETSDWVEHVWKKADAILFLFGRLHFYHVDELRRSVRADLLRRAEHATLGNLTATGPLGPSGERRGEARRHHSLKTNWRLIAVASTDLLAFFEL
jgi:hypothetical protein